MGEDGGVVDEEGGVLVALSEVDDVVVEEVGAVIGWGGGEVFAVLDDGWVPVACGLTGFFVGGVFDIWGQVMVVGPHAIFVEAGVVDEGWEGAWQLPFADEGGAVSGGFEEIGVGEVVSDGVEWGVFFGDEVGVTHAEVAVSETVLTGHESHSGWGAEGVCVERFESGAFGGEAIEVGGAMGFVAVAAEFLGTEVIGEDEDDVGFWLGGVGWEEEGDCEEGAEDVGEHVDETPGIGCGFGGGCGGDRGGCGHWG